MNNNFTAFCLFAAPRIPTDKRVFTTTHTPTCVFQDVDERSDVLQKHLSMYLILNIGKD